MRHFCYAKLFVLVLLASFNLTARINADYRLHQAFVQAQQGQFANAVEETKALIDSGALHAPELGRAWALLGFVYKEQGHFAEARRALDESMRVLGHNPDFLLDYGMALDYEAALNEEQGQLDAAERVWIKALRIFEDSGNRAASAGVYRSLAELKLREKDVRRASRFLERALDAGAGADLTPAERAEYALTEGGLDLEEKRFPEAANAYKQSLEFCRIAFGDDHYVTAWGLMLLGNALAQEGELDQALADMREGLSVLAQSLGTQSLKYWAAEIAYARVLDRAGWHSQAAEVKKSAERAMKDMFGRQCGNCTISVSALR